MGLSSTYVSKDVCPRLNPIVLFESTTLMKIERNKGNILFLNVIFHYASKLSNHRPEFLKPLKRS